MLPFLNDIPARACKLEGELLSVFWENTVGKKEVNDALRKADGWTEYVSEIVDIVDVDP